MADAASCQKLCTDAQRPSPKPFFFGALPNLPCIQLCYVSARHVPSGRPCFLLWQRAWLKRDTSARGAASGTRPSWTSLPVAASNMWRTARSAANPTCSIYAGARPIADLRSTQSSKADAKSRVLRGPLHRQFGAPVGRRRPDCYRIGFPARKSGSSILVAVRVCLFFPSFGGA
jgi:hypothetical protein